MVLQKKTQITGFYGRPETWGTVVQTIRSGSAGFTCMTTFGHWIAVACYDGVVRIYHAVTGALKLSLGPMDAIRVVGGTPDGSTLFCVHQKNLITLWDIQTGGLIRNFALTKGFHGTDISLKGRYLACGFSSSPIKVLEVANEAQDLATPDSPPNSPFCWLEPEEQLVIADGLSVHIWDVVAGRIVRNFTVVGCKGRSGSEQGEIEIKERIFGMVYSQALDRLVVITESPLGGGLTIIDPQAGRPLGLLEVPKNLTCFTLSRTTEDLVCGTRADGLSILNLSRWSLGWRHLKHPHTVKRISSLPNGTLAVDSGNSGVQLLSLDDRYARASHSTLALATSLLDQGRIVAFRSPTPDFVQLLETSTMSNLITIYTLSSFADPLAAVICASLENRTVVRYVWVDGNARLQLHRFGDEDPRWTVGADGSLLACGISPAGTRLVTFHRVESATRICVWDAGNGQLQAELSVNNLNSSPPYITIDSETRFYSHHDNYRVPYDLNISPGPHATHQIICHERQSWTSTVKPMKRRYEVDSSREWVVSGSKRICWIPPGYIGSTEGDYYWIGPNVLVMKGEGGASRMFSFCS